MSHSGKNVASSIPRVSCLMVTANRKKLAARAVNCFIQQRYPNKELVVVDDGDEDYSSLFKGIPAENITYKKISLKGSSAVLGTLRNLSLENASGDYMVQWDDDDWYHPDRIIKQARYLDEGYDACCLAGSLMHLDNPEFFDLPYIGFLPKGIPGSIMHRKNDNIRYPEYRRSEDTLYLREWMKHRYTMLPELDAGLFIRCFHGSNTWDEQHFTRRIRNSPKNWLYFVYHKYLKKDLKGHPRFQLPEGVRSAFDMYLEDSEALGLFAHSKP